MVAVEDDRLGPLRICWRPEGVRGLPKKLCVKGWATVGHWRFGRPEAVRGRTPVHHFYHEQHGLDELEHIVPLKNKSTIGDIKDDTLRKLPKSGIR